MATNLSKFKNEAVRLAKHAPWTLLDDVVPMDIQKFSNALRTNTSLPAIKISQAAITAAEYFVNTNEQNTDMFPYRLVRSTRKANRVYALEIHYSPNECLVIRYTSGSELQISNMDLTNGVANPVTSWNVPESLLFAIPLLLIPHILVLEKEAGEDGLKDVLNALSTEFSACHQCASKADFDPDTIDHLYYLTIIMEVMDKITVKLNNAGLPDDIPDDLFNNPIKGDVIVQNMPAKIRFVEAAGKANRFNATTEVTMADAIAQYSNYSAHRNWTPAERLLIPRLPDKMPVMKEVLRIAKRITDTHNDSNPVVNVMWRGITSYGKSTGVKQLAAILNMPLLKMTCHPSMETQDFMSQYVPKTSNDSGAKLVRRELDTAPAVANSDPIAVAGVPYLQEAIAHVGKMEKKDRDELFGDIQAFYEDAYMDSVYAFERLTGLSQKEDPTVVYSLYTLVQLTYLKMEADKKVQELQQELDQAKQSTDGKPVSGKPEFVHIVSDYVKALVNGYIVEIQEASRIRDSGVLVGLNEFDTPGSMIRLVDGNYAQRHSDAIQIITDNVGYASCRPIDPSAIRRQGMIIDSYEMSKEDLISRVKWNTGCKDKQLLDKSYNVWEKVKHYCEENAIEDGSVSATELERLVQAVMYDGADSFADNVDDCVISKATSSIEDQKAIRSVIAALAA